jgi:hypothetical protein
LAIRAFSHFAVGKDMEPRLKKWKSLAQDHLGNMTWFMVVGFGGLSMRFSKAPMGM